MGYWERESGEGVGGSGILEEREREWRGSGREWDTGRERERESGEGVGGSGIMGERESGEGVGG